MPTQDELTMLIKARDQASRVITGVQGKMRALGRSASQLKGPMIAAGGAAVGAVISFGRLGDEVQKMSIKTGFSTEKLSELRFAAEQSGTNLGGLEKAVKKMQKGLLDAELGLSTAVDSLDMLGISIDDLQGLSPEEQFETLASSISQVEDASRRSALAQNVFGRAGADLLPMLTLTKEEMDALAQEARDLGIVMDQETANKAAKMNDSLNAAKQVFTGMAIELGAVLAPAITAIMRIFEALPGPVQKLIPIAGVLFITLQRGFHSTKAALIGTGLGILIIGLGLAVQQVITHWDFFRAQAVRIFNAVKDAFMTAVNFVWGLYNSKLGFLLPGGALVKAIIFLKDNWDTVFTGIKDAFQAVSDAVHSAFRAGFGWALPDGALVRGVLFLKTTWQTVWNFIKTAFTTVVDAITSAYTSKLGWLLPGGGIVKGILFIKDTWESVWTAVRASFTTTVNTLSSAATFVHDRVIGAFNGIKDNVLAVWDAIVGGIKGAVNTVIAAINTFIRGVNRIEIRFPGVSIPFAPDIPGFSIGLPDIPEIPHFKKGGIVPGPTGSPQLVMAHGGEGIFPGGAGINLNITVYGSVLGAELADIVADGLEEARRTGALADA